jgi:hypothetical protein
MLTRSVDPKPTILTMTLIFKEAEEALEEGGSHTEKPQT